MSLMKSHLPQKGGRYHQGFYELKNPEKYVGDPNKVIFRSGLEKRWYKYFDNEKNIVNFGVEEFFIPYVSPTDNKVHRYFVDAIFKLKNGERVIAEIKSWSQCQEPKKPKTNNKKSLMKYVTELKTYEINQAKWDAAEKFCKQKGITFMVLTEKNLPKSNP